LPYAGKQRATQVSFRRFAAILRARWLLASSIFFAVVAAGAVLSLTAQKQYIATAQVVVDLGVDPVVGTQDQLVQLPSYLATQLDVINSDRVAQRVVELLKIDQDPRARAQWQQTSHGRGDFKDSIIRALEGGLIVTPSRESNVINIGFQAPDPKQAAILANAFAQAYIDTNIQLKVQPATQYTAWFAERVKALRADLEAKQAALFEYQRENGIVPTDDRVNIENARLGSLSDQLSSIEAQSRDAQSRLQQVRTNPEVLPEVLASPVIVNLKQQLSGEQVRRDDMLNRLGPNHPEFVQAEATLANLRARIAQETQRIADSVAAVAEADLRRVNEARTALQAQKDRVINLKHGQDRQALLENDVVNAQRNLDAVNQRLAQTALESQTKQSNIVLLTSAVEPIYPSSPNLRLNLAVAVFLGGLLGIGIAMALELLQGKLRSGEELSHLLDVPLLGTLTYRPVRRRLAAQRF
jgi:chain length determinant protein EpsF